jgi:hypothetical protein
VAWAPSGQPLLGGSCAAPAPAAASRTAKTPRAAIITLSAGSWHLADLVLPRALPRGPVTVLGLRTSGTRTTAILAAGTGAATAVVVAWSAPGGTSWTLSPALRTGPAAAPAISLWADGSAGLLAGRRAATIGWQAAGWRQLPPAPAGTAALAQSPAGLPEALAASGGTMTVWQLARAAWARLQTVHVTIPYGSSS